MEPLSASIFGSVLQYGALGLVVVMVIAFLLMMRALLTSLKETFDKHATATSALAQAIASSDKAAIERHHQSTAVIVDKMGGHTSTVVDEVREMAERIAEKMDELREASLSDHRDTRSHVNSALQPLMIKSGLTPPRPQGK